jgi:signal transduction histidine kinase
MKKLQLSFLLMVATVVLLAAFEGYWLQKLYKDEYAGLRKEVDVSFRETMNKLQLRRFETDTALIGEAFTTSIRRSSTPPSKTVNSKKPSTFIYQRLDNPAILNHISPDSIESISVKSGFSFKGAPNPALIELMLKQSMGKADSVNKIVFRVDSSFKERFGNQLRERSGGITISIKTNDSVSLNQLADSMKKLGGSFVSLPMIRAAKTLQERMSKTDSARKGRIIPEDKVFVAENPIQTTATATIGSPIIRFLSSNKTINDSIPVRMVDSAYRTELGKTNKKLKFAILFESYKDSIPNKWNFKKDTTDAVITDKVFVGYSTPYSYQAKFERTNAYVLSKMQMQIGGSVLLLLLVAGSFIMLYRNLLAQQRLAEIKNDFISNITHELKTPIATVGVAIEALRNFNAMQSPERTKEYLDISAAELQRLSLLVDKVLKLSMFEKQQIELNKEPFDLKELMDETLKIMKLQFDKHKATVHFTVSENSFMIEADKLHITSVIYNLLDNALKYGGNKPVIDVALNMPNSDLIEIVVSDTGIGIASQHQGKIFDKFFRVPTGDKHNIKGYGLGLSYVSEVVKTHKGTIQLNSEPGKGSTFIVQLPVRDR